MTSLHIVKYVEMLTSAFVRHARFVVKPAILIVIYITEWLSPDCKIMQRPAVNKY
jgi:hypothetical protein